MWGRGTTTKGNPTPLLWAGESLLVSSNSLNKIKIYWIKQIISTLKAGKWDKEEDK